MTTPEEPTPPPSETAPPLVGVTETQDAMSLNAAVKSVRARSPASVSPMKEAQEKTRSRLATSVAFGLAGLVVFVLVIVAGDKIMMYQLIWNAPRDSNGSLVLSEESLVDLKKEQDQASSALITVLVTAGFSALSGALGFYFGNQSE